MRYNASDIRPRRCGMSDKDRIKYYKVGNGLIKYDGAFCYYVAKDGKWIADGDVTVRVLTGDLSSDPKLINEIEAGPIYERLIGQAMP
jgi:hypothetical protein